MSDRDRRLAEMMGIRDDGYWWCYKCLAEKSPVQVTFHENCALCGTRVIWTENPDFSTPEWRARLMDWAVEQEWWQTFVPWAMRKWFDAFHEDRTDCNYFRYLWRNLPDLVYEYRRGA